MIAYNIYYDNSRINNRPLSKENLENDILSKKYIFKQNGKDLIKIDINKIKIIETVLV